MPRRKDFSHRVFSCPRDNLCQSSYRYTLWTFANRPDPRSLARCANAEIIPNEGVLVPTVNLPITSARLTKYCRHIV
jgi:hypothetical protein